MYLMYYLNKDGNRVYTLKVINMKYIFYYKFLYIFITEIQNEFLFCIYILYSFNK